MKKLVVQVLLKLLVLLLFILFFMNKVGKGNIAVVSPPSTYDNVAHFEPPAGGDQVYNSPPDYSSDTEDNVFSDRNIRRGE